MKPADHVTLNFKTTMSTAAVLMIIEEYFNNIWHSGLLHKLPKLVLSTILIKLINFFQNENSDLS
jgi:hypothetical protein